MPSLSAEDRQTAKSIDEWIITAQEEVNFIGGWRNADPEDREDRYWSWNRPGPGTVHGGSMPGRFYDDTVQLVARIVTRFPKLDPTPLHDVYESVFAWHEDHNADAIPPQSILERKLDLASQLLNVLRYDIEERRGRGTIAELPHRDSGLDGDLRLARWFNVKTKGYIYPDLLKRARADGRLNGEKLGGRWAYSVGAVRRLWPDCGDQLGKAYEDERKRTKPND